MFYTDSHCFRRFYYQLSPDFVDSEQVTPKLFTMLNIKLYFTPCNVTERSGRQTHETIFYIFNNVLRI